MACSLTVARAMHHKFQIHTPDSTIKTNIACTQWHDGRTVPKVLPVLLRTRAGTRD